WRLVYRLAGRLATRSIPRAISVRGSLMHYCQSTAKEAPTGPTRGFQSSARSSEVSWEPSSTTSSGNNGPSSVNLRDGSAEGAQRVPAIRLLLQHRLVLGLGFDGSMQLCQHVTELLSRRRKRTRSHRAFLGRVFARDGLAYVSESVAMPTLRELDPRACLELLNRHLLRPV